MKMTIAGFEIIAGTSSKTGKPYDMSRLHTLIPLQASDNAKGSCGTSYDCPAHVLEKVRHIQPPFVAEVEMHDVQAFGKRVQQVAGLSPIERAKAA